MPIANETPLVLPPTPGEAFPHLWLYGITVLAPTVSTGAITIDALPFNADTGRMASGDHVQRIQTDQLWLAAQQVPEVGAAIAAIVAAFDPLKAWIAAKEATAAQPG